MHARVLKYLDAVVRAGSIRKAALQLHVAPTAVNRQILELESQLGAPLFERLPKGLRLTPLGETVLAHVRQTLQEHRALLARVQEFKGAHRGEVTLVATAGLAGSVLPGLLQVFRQRHPGVVMCITDLPVDALAEAVEAGQADLGLAYGLPQRAALKTIATTQWPMGAVVPPGHPLAALPSVELVDCIGYPLILPAASMSIRRSLDAAFAAAGLTPLASVETTSTALIRQLVLLGSGIALLNPLDVLEERSRGTLAFVPLSDAALPPQALRLVARARSDLSPPAAELAVVLKAGLAALRG